MAKIKKNNYFENSPSKEKINSSYLEELTLDTEDEQVCDKEGNLYTIFKITEHKDLKEIHVHTNRGEIIYKSLDEANRELFCV